MEYGKPVKLQDGRYFVKISSSSSGGGSERVLKQINGVEVLQEQNCFKVPCDLKEFDDRIISQAEVCSEEWFGKKIDVEQLKKAFDSSVSSGIFEASPVPKKTKVFDCERNEVSREVLVSGVHCDIIVELSGIWFLKKSFGPVWRLVQARLKKESSFPRKYMFSDDDVVSSDDDEYKV